MAALACSTAPSSPILNVVTTTSRLPEQRLPRRAAQLRRRPAPVVVRRRGLLHTAPGAHSNSTAGSSGSTAERTSPPPTADSQRVRHEPQRPHPAGRCCRDGPTFCVDERYPHFRFSFSQESPTIAPNVRVEVVSCRSAAWRRTCARPRTSRPSAGRGWRLSDKIKLEPDHGLKHGGWRLVAIHIRVRNGKPDALVRVDDIVVDPRVRG